MATTTTSSSSAPANGTAPHPHRLLLVSAPRTASNLLVKILNIHQQPNVLTNDKGGYFFFDAYTSGIGNERFKTPLNQWPEEWRTELRNLYQQSLDKLEEWSARAAAENKIMFSKEHSFLFLNPAILFAPPGGGDDASSSSEPMSKEEEFFRLRIPATERYGGGAQQQTWSAGNRTVLSDEYLRTWQMAFLIRHPALAFPSMFRAVTRMTREGILNEDGVRGSSPNSTLTLRWTRMLFDWCAAQAQTSNNNNGDAAAAAAMMPLLLDAHDVIHNPNVVLRFAEAAGLDKDAVQFEWNAEEKKLDWGLIGNNDFGARSQAIMLSTLQNSTGIVKEKAPDVIDIKAEAEKWKEEFGPEVGGMIEKAVLDAMPDYEYLREKRVRA
ncbi:uncharacterized protein B0T15DRAFT_250192 [Chaetomium strumarium]|uniref:Uncharacterized protein n=1 Tax=Chaetomium strumarium TaxID=1170767 RepID=A0AAJ0GR70_9PEZI|nr:hypothetical protein B0T15DRAFT_250192 [Chaetomium strumarium]